MTCLQSHNALNAKRWGIQHTSNRISIIHENHAFKNVWETSETMNLMQLNLGAHHVVILTWIIIQYITGHHCLLIIQQINMLIVHPLHWEGKFWIWFIYYLSRCLLNGSNKDVILGSTIMPIILGLRHKQQHIWKFWIYVNHILTKISLISLIRSIMESMKRQETSSIHPHG